MANLDELKRKYDLIDNEVYPKLRAEYLDFIVKQSGTNLNPEILRGMLLLINESDKWEANFMSERRKLDKKVEE